MSGQPGIDIRPLLFRPSLQNRNVREGRSGAAARIKWDSVKNPHHSTRTSGVFSRMRRTTS